MKTIEQVEKNYKEDRQWMIDRIRECVRQKGARNTILNLKISSQTLYRILNKNICKQEKLLQINKKIIDVLNK